mgnify:FL=1
MKLTEDKLRKVIREEVQKLIERKVHPVESARSLIPYIKGKTVVGGRKGDGSLTEGEIVVEFADGTELSFSGQAVVQTAENKV